jgi:hypothetical protein
VLTHPQLRLRCELTWRCKLKKKQLKSIHIEVLRNKEAKEAKEKKNLLFDEAFRWACRCDDIMRYPRRIYANYGRRDRLLTPTARVTVLAFRPTAADLQHVWS